MLLEGIIMTASLNIQGNRSTSGIFNILTGKKSIQTVQDVHIYKLGQFYGVYKDLDKIQFDEVVAELIDQKALTLIRPKTIVPTENGEAWLSQAQLGFEHFNGLLYNTIEPVFTNRLLLLIQTLTNIVKKHFSFIPIVDEDLITNWVRQVYKQTNDPEQVLEKLYNELSSVLMHVPDRQAHLFVDRLTGYQHYGRSFNQLAALYDIPIHDIKLELKKTQHQLLKIIDETGVYPVLGAVLGNIHRSKMITDSAMQTYHMLKKTYKPEEIAIIRGLKLNTIYDHIIEIIYFDQGITLTPYVSNKDKQEIMHAIQQTDSYLLKDIKSHLHADVSYFQIRLVMAVLQREGDSYAHGSTGKGT